MENTKIFFKDTFAVIGKAGQGPANNPQAWVLSLWNDANANFSEIADMILKSESNAPLSVWGAMNDMHESNKRWGESGKYMAGCETKIDTQPPEGWTKWIIPAQTYMTVKCTMQEYGEVFSKIADDPEIRIVGTVHERYPEPGNPSILELWFPVAAGLLLCQSCSMPMTKPDDFGTGKDGIPNHNYCCHCYENGALHNDITMDQLISDVLKLVDIEAAHPNLLSTPLLKYIKEWLILSKEEKTASIPALHSKLVDGQDCDFTGTQWEQIWLADGRVCHCLACVAARRCISDIKLMAANN
jgi:predicted transcriptional regulator YdeE